MLDSKALRSDPEGVAANLARRGFVLDVEAFRALEERRRHWQIEADRLRAARNAGAKAVGMAKAKGEDVAPLLQQAEALTADLAAAEAGLNAVAAESDQWLLGLPNLLHVDVPDGRDEGGVRQRQEGHRRPATHLQQGSSGRDHERTFGDRSGRGGGLRLNATRIPAPAGSEKLRD